MTRQVCGECFGAGRVNVPRAAYEVHQGVPTLGTEDVTEFCKPCKGRGFIEYEVVSYADEAAPEGD